MYNEKIDFKSLYNLTDEERAAIVDEYRKQRDWRIKIEKYPDTRHIVACVASDLLCKTSRQWNGKRGTEAYAAVLAVLIRYGEIKVADPIIDKPCSELSHANMTHARYVETDGPIGHGWECSKCGEYLQAG